MNLSFYKYQGAGNDFVIINALEEDIQLSTEQIRHLCHRNFGIGADGLIILKPDNSTDFYMQYFNSDGNESSMCGNGGRCIAMFAHRIGLVQEQASFMAIDGLHKAEIVGDIVNLEMQSISQIEKVKEDFVLDSGSPHYVAFTTDLEDFPLKEEAQKIRYSERFKENGINVNFVEVLNKNSIFVRTYERGVEAETLACGTGVVASSIVYSKLNQLSDIHIKVKAMGGNLEVTASEEDGMYKNIWLKGPAKEVFQGKIEI